MQVPAFEPKRILSCQAGVQPGSEHAVESQREEPTILGLTAPLVHPQPQPKPFEAQHHGSNPREQFRRF